MKYLLITAGIISMSLGIIGIFLPLLPTTPLLLLAAALFARSSRRLHQWLLNHKVFGTYIRSFMEDRVIPVRVKIYAISLMWTSIILSAIIVDKLLVRCILAVTAICVTIHILSYKSHKPPKQ
ncbi:MAG: YbaN family protein [Prevotellaceae bacterium]|nr:YbaN family protein [Prevotellaceae bacterium]